MRYTTAISLALPLMAAACSSPPQKPQQPADPYAAAVLQRPQPADESARVRECGWLQSEIANQRGLAYAAFSATPDRQLASRYVAEAQQRIVALETRFKAIGCNRPPAAPAS